MSIVHEAGSCAHVPAILRDGIGWPIARAAAAIAGAHSEALMDEGLSLRTFSVLAMVGQGAARTQLGVAQTLGLDKTTLVAAIDELERRGLVARTIDPHDRRARILGITAGGSSLLSRAEMVVRETESRLFGDLSAVDAQRLKDALHALIGGPLRAYFDRAGSCV
jgi:DNA-binding MarR family transcriptional regulator